VSGWLHIVPITVSHMMWYFIILSLNAENTALHACMQSPGAINCVARSTDITRGVPQIAEIIEQEMERVECVHATEWRYIYPYWLLFAPHAVILHSRPMCRLTERVKWINRLQIASWWAQEQHLQLPHSLLVQSHWEKSRPIQSVQKELDNGVPNVTLRRVLRKHLHLKAYKLSIFQHLERTDTDGTTCSHTQEEERLVAMGYTSAHTGSHTDTTGTTTHPIGYTGT
jgi:hypothetical protein